MSYNSTFFIFQHFFEHISSTYQITVASDDCTLRPEYS